MSAKVYIVTDIDAIKFIVDNDIEGFKNYLSEEEYSYFGEPENFNTEEEALAFCAGLGYGIDERAPIEKYPLRSFEEMDLPFIKEIEKY